MSALQDELHGLLDGGAIMTGPAIRRTFLLLTRGHFTHSSNYGPLRKFLEDVTWNDDPHNPGKLRVDPQYDVDTDAVADSIPAVFFGLGKIRFNQEVIGNYAGHSDDRSVEYKTVEASAPFQWACCAKDADFAGNLAETIFALFTSIYPMLLSQMRLRTFAVTEVDMPISISAKDKPSYYRVDLRGQMTYNHVVALHTESHRLKKIELASEVA